MKTFKSADDLKRVALSRGASASFSGSKFNSTADKVVSIKQPKEEEIKGDTMSPLIPEKQPAVDLAPIVQSAVDAMAASVQAVTMDSSRVMKEVAKMVEKISLQPLIAEPSKAEPMAKAWKLKVNRDTRGFMDTVDIVRVG